MVEVFEKLKKVFNENGFRLYMIGSTSRDFLLNNKIRDFDFVTDARPLDIKKFLDVYSAFEKYGVVKLKLDGEHVDIATLREEGDYLDKRHPSYIKLIKDVEIDYKRRDLTINAIYIDENYQILDVSIIGVEDLKNKKLRFIGDIETRIKEDPLRILRARRFIEEYNLSISKEDEDILNSYEYLIHELNPDKVKEELAKLRKVRERYGIK